MSPNFEHEVMLLALINFLVVEPEFWLEIVGETHVKERNVVGTFGNEQGLNGILGVPNVVKALLDDLHSVEVKYL